jgi:hypothetical protein
VRHSSSDIRAHPNVVAVSRTPAITVPSGSTVTFKWTGLHDVNQIPSGTCMPITVAENVDGSSGLLISDLMDDVSCLRLKYKF